MDRSIPRLALVGLAVLVLGVVLVTGATSTSSLGTHNPSWDGTADLRSIADERTNSEIVRNVSAYDDVSANGTLAIVLSPAEPYGEDADALRRYLDRGGTVLIAEDYRTNADPLLSTLGASARFDGRPVRDERNYEQSPSFVEATVTEATVTDPSVTEDRPLTRGVETLVLNRGTVVEPGGATVLVRTSRDAYLDVNRNGELDEDETPAERPVMTVEPVGDGHVVTLADPSIFINSMLEYGDNRALATQLTERYDRVLFDVSHSPGIPPLAALVLTIRESFLLQAAVGVVLVLGVVGRHRLAVVVDRLRRIRRNHPSEAPQSPTDSDAIARAVSREHPSWDESRIERIADGAVAQSAREETTVDRTSSDRSTVELSDGHEASDRGPL